MYIYDIDSNLDRARKLRAAYPWVSRIRPQALAQPLVKLFAPYERRIIVQLQDGLQLYLDPFSHLGLSILDSGSYEDEIENILRESLRPGNTFLDIGANEGYYSALAARLVGPQGRVIAVEPQSRLLDIIKINLALNGFHGGDIIHAAVALDSGPVVEISLTPFSNTGASSLVNKYSWGGREKVSTITGEEIRKTTNVAGLDIVKVDVEGYEPEVVQSLLPLLREKAIGKLLIDYHLSILQKRSIDPRITHEAIIDCNYSVVTEAQGFSGFFLYDRG